MIAETAIVSKSGVADFMQMSISLYLDFRVAIADVLGSLNKHE